MECFRHFPLNMATANENIVRNETAEEEQANNSQYLGIQLLAATRSKKSKEAISLINKGADIHLKDAAGWNCFHFAAVDGLVDVIKVLLEKGANVVIQDSDGQTPLHKAASRGHTDAIVVLVAHGPKNFTLDKLGRSPLEMAIKNKQPAAVERLLMFGSELPLRDWSWSMNPELEKKEREITEHMERHKNLAAGFKFEMIQYDVRKIPPNTTMDMAKLGVSINSKDFRKEFYLYCCRMQIEFTDIKQYISEEENEEVFSDVYEVRTWYSPKKVITLTIVTKGVPRKSEKIDLISPVGKSGRVDNVTVLMEENKTEVTVTLKLAAFCSTRFALSTVKKKERVAVSKAARLINPEAEPEAVIDIPKDTFSTAGELELQLVDTSETNDECMEQESETVSGHRSEEEKKPEEAPVLMTSVLDISMTDGQQPKKEIPIKLPIHKADGTQEFVVLATSVTDSTKVKDWDIIEAKPDSSGKAALFTISHFSIYAGANKKKVDENVEEVINAVMNSIKKIRKIEFVVLTRPPANYDIETNVVVICGSKRKVKVKQRPLSQAGYQVTSQSKDTFEVQEGQWFQIHLTGNIKETNGNEFMKLCFKSNDNDNQQRFQICSKDMQDTNSVGCIEIKAEEQRELKKVVEVDAGDCFCGKIQKEVSSGQTETLLKDIVQFGITAKFKKKEPAQVDPGTSKKRKKKSKKGAFGGLDDMGDYDDDDEDDDEEEEDLNDAMEELIRKDESVISVLGWRRLISLCKKMDNEEARLFGMQLRIGPNTLDKMLKKTEKQKMDGHFALLIMKKWRGKRPHKAQVETLTQALRAINRGGEADQIDVDYELEATQQ